MGLAKGLYRRQATYWWRRRFEAPQDGRSREIAISLRVQRPDIARRIADALNEKAHSVAKRLESRMSTFENARHELAELVNTLAFTLDPGAEASLNLFEVRRSTNREESPAVPTPQQEHDLLLDMAREAEAELRRSAHHNRSESAKAGVSNPLADAIATEEAFAVIFTMIAERGSAARLGDDRGALAVRFSPEMIEFIAREIAYHAERERELSWSLGPPPAYFEDKMRAAGFAPSLGAMRLLRRDYLLVFAALLEKAEQRYSPSPVAAVLNLLTEPRAPKPVAAPSAIAATTKESDARSEAPCANGMRSAAGVTTPFPEADQTQLVDRAPSRAPCKTFTAHVQTLVRQNAKSGAWIPKTASQHETVGRLFVKLVGSDDPGKMGQAHIGAFRSLLDDLPKNWGKSPADAARTIDEICARAQDLDEEEVGLAPGTIDRQLTQLSNILAHLRDNGVFVGEVTPKMRTGGANRPRGVFDLTELNTIFTSAVFTGCASAADRLTTGDQLIYDGQFFIPIIGRHMLGRLHEIAGLMIDDIDFDRHAVIFRDNAERSVKSEGANRRQPAVPEIIRIGFFDYCHDMREAGHKIVFPCLRERGAKTPLSNLYYKKLKLLLEAVLPSAAEQRKSFHSFRTDGNTLMANANVNDPIRHAVMGHAHSGVNEQHYLSEIYDEAKLMALSAIPLVTSHLKAYRRN